MLPSHLDLLDRYGVLQSHRNVAQFMEQDGKLVSLYGIWVFAKRNKRSTWKQYQLVYHADKTWEFIPWKDM